MSSTTNTQLSPCKRSGFTGAHTHSSTHTPMNTNTLTHIYKQIHKHTYTNAYSVESGEIEKKQSNIGLK